MALSSAAWQEIRVRFGPNEQTAGARFANSLVGPPFEGKAHSRSLHFAPPYFLWNLVALMHFMRLSLQKGAHEVLSGAAWQEIRVRFGRDDKFVWARGRNCRSLRSFIHS